MLYLVNRFLLRQMTSPVANLPPLPGDDIPEDVRKIYDRTVKQHLYYIPQHRGLHLRTWKQLKLLEHLEASLRRVLVTDMTINSEQRASDALSMFGDVVARIEVIGGISEEFLRVLFQFGEQVLIALEATLGHRHGEQKVDFQQLLAPRPPSYNPSTKDKCHFRRNLLINHTELMRLKPMDSLERMHIGTKIIELGLGKSFKVSVQGGDMIDIPAVQCVDDEWRAEMFHWSMHAVMGLAQLLGARFMGTEVIIQGQTVPGTGRGKGLLKDWIAREVYVVCDPPEETHVADEVNETEEAAKPSDQRYV